jgi:predicted MFS family arabinose efflux permease
MLWWISFFNYADRQALNAVFPLLQSEMRLENVALGGLSSAFAWFYGLSAPLAGFIVDRVRRKSAILGGLHAWSVICMATALSRRYSQLFFFRAAEGLGETFYYPASMSMLSDYHGTATRSRAMGIHQTSVYIGTIAGSSFAGLIGQFYGWRLSFVVFGGLGILLGLVLHFFLIEPQRGADLHCQESAIKPQVMSLTQLARLLRCRWSVALLLLAFMCANFVAVVALSWMPKYLHDSFGMDLAEAGLKATLYLQLGSMLGASLGGWLADYCRQRVASGRILVQMGGVLAAAPFVFLSGQARSEGLLILAMSGWGLFKGVYDANIFASAFDVIPAEARGTLAGFMNMVGWLGGGAPAPIIIGALADVYGLGPAIASAAVFYVLSAAFLLLAGIFSVKQDLSSQALV